MVLNSLDCSMEENKTEQKPVQKSYIIIVNGREKEVEFHKASYNEIIILAFGQIDESPNAVYTVTYSKGNKGSKGSMVQGDVVTVKQGVVFNVTRTDKS